MTTPRPLPLIAADAMLADCGECWPGPGNPCDCAPGFHLARFARARRKGVLSDYDMGTVLAGLEVFESSTVIYAEAGLAA